MRKTFLPVLLLTSLALTPVLAAPTGAVQHHQPPKAQQLRSFKGWELYSWQVKGQLWRFSLLEGTNRTKSVDEIIKAKPPIYGVDALKRRLSKLAPGEYVFWNHALIAEKGKLKLPPRRIIEQVKVFSRKHKLELATP